MLYIYMQMHALLIHSDFERDRTPHNRQGFTIVELLVVIVVIAILAAITIVAYNGIRNRADAARASATADQFAKVLKLYSVNNNGTYPSSAASPTGEYCLGKPADFPATGPFASGQCLYNPANYTVSASQTLADSLAPYATISSGQLSQAPLGSETWRGIRYSYIPGMTDYYGKQVPPRLEWVVNGGEPCDPGTGGSNGGAGLWWGSTWCTFDLT